VSEQSKKLEEQLDTEDWALIISKEGNLKGVFIPDSPSSEIVPHSIVYITEKYFGIDITEEMSDDFEQSDKNDGTRLLH